MYYWNSRLVGVLMYVLVSFAGQDHGAWSGVGKFKCEYGPVHGEGIVTPILFVYCVAFHGWDWGMGSHTWQLQYYLEACTLDVRCGYISPKYFTLSHFQWLHLTSVANVALFPDMRQWFSQLAIASGTKQHELPAVEQFLYLGSYPHHMNS